MTTLNSVISATLAFGIIIFTVSCKSHAETKKDNIKSETLFPGSTIKLDSSKRYIYLTFDDGPQPPGTTICKDVFINQGVKATFFVVGLNQFDQKRKNIIEIWRNLAGQYSW